MSFAPLMLLLCALAQAGAEPVVAQFEPYSARYHSREEVEATLLAWVAARPQFTRLDSLPAPDGRQGARTLLFGSAGEPPLEERPIIVLVGGLDGLSISGAEAVLSVTSALLEEPELLPPGLAFCALPWSSPEALQRAFEYQDYSGGDNTPVDADGDGAFDEDGAEDIDGDGLVSWMLVPDPAGTYVVDEELFLRAAHPGEEPRYLLAREGDDDDGDGLYNEDGVGGLRLDLGFPTAWEGPGPSGLWGTRPLEAQGARALAEYLYSRRVRAVLLFQGNHGGLVLSDAARGEGQGSQLAESYLRALSLPQGTPIPVLEPYPGACSAWVTAALGALSLEVSIWGDNRLGLQTESAESQRPPARQLHTDRGVLEIDKGWREWVDDGRGGIGLDPWRPVPLDGGGEAYLGGWRPRTRFNPPEEKLAENLVGLDKFVLEVAAVGGFDLRWIEARRVGYRVLLSVELVNRGWLPSGGSDSGWSMRLQAADGVHVMGGEAERVLGSLGAGADAAAQAAWSVLCAPGTSLRVTASGPAGETLHLDCAP